MFDTIGTRRDPEAHRRQALATLIASLLVGGGTAFTLALGAWTAHEVLAPPPVDDTPLVLLEIEPEDLEVEPPPIAPPRLGGGQEAQQGSPDAAPEPDEPQEVQELDPTPVDTPVTDAVNRGVDGGTGDAETDIDAPPGPGTASGVPGGTGQYDARPVIHRSEVELRRQVMPEFPDGVSEGQACRVSIDIDAEGRPEAIHVSECDAPYALEAKRAIERWRWYRPGRGVRTLYRVVFEPR
ncbi:MAG: hypothetical protein R3F61_19930 [Myxococcota bacterium]